MTWAPCQASPKVQRAIARLVHAPPSRRVQIFRSFSPAVQRGVSRALGRGVPAPHRRSIGPGRFVRGNACKGVDVWRTYTNVLGIQLWDYHEQVSWCWNGRNRITDVFRTTSGHEGAPFWSFKGDTGARADGGRGHSFFRAFAQGHFELCFPTPIGCVASRSPSITVTVHAGGRYSYDAQG